MMEESHNGKEPERQTWMEGVAVVLAPPSVLGECSRQGSQGCSAAVRGAEMSSSAKTRSQPPQDLLPQFTPGCCLQSESCKAVLS